jgi:serine/threonine protein phosphatase PrpC
MSTQSLASSAKSLDMLAIGPLEFPMSPDIGRDVRFSAFHRSVGGYSSNRRPSGKRLSAFSLFGGFLIAWLALSSTAFATQSLLSSSSGTPQGLLRAGVSVVRLLVKYEKTDNSGPVYCTGLGAIVASWPAQNAGDQNSWVLTDSSLVNGNQALCANGDPQATLTSIEVYLSTAYNQQTMTFQSSIGSVTCQDGGCHSGPALFALGRTQGQLLPFIDLAQLQNSNNQDMAIKLTTSAGLASTSNTSVPSSLPTPSIAAVSSSDASTFQTQTEKFLTPSQVSPTNNTLEAGTPLINTNGQMTSLHQTSVSGKQTTTNLQSFIEKTIPDIESHTANIVHDGWQRGMDAYTNKDFSEAHKEFQLAADANPSFQAAKLFAASSLNLEKNTHPDLSNSLNPLNMINIGGISIRLWQLAIAIVLMLAVVLLVITLLFGQSRQQSLEADLKEADRQATIEAPQIAEMERAKAQQIAEMETAQRANAQHSPSPYEQPIQQSPVLVPAEPSPSQLPCPRCRELVPWGANYCANCRLLLSPSESGLHLRAQVISLPADSIRSLADQPTMPPPSALTMPATSIAEQPTVEITPNRVHGQFIELEKTEPYNRYPVSDTRFQLVVGTRSDPGIKRKYKPNEDSLFAAQGLIEETPITHPYGLFVIADGMGGHANGQDASRLAIQTIIEYILPRLIKQPTDEYAKVLVEGIQSANLAVHQRNIEQNGDMGTTVTGALVVDNVAYVVNVGDSRTYLYREQDGLKKITNDHSVVASLVEAGIIKPDDIYTHPKRSHIYRSLGEKPNVEIDLFTVPLQEGDKLLLCSDGLWDMVRDPKIEDLIKNPAPNPSVTSDSLIQAAYEGGGEDNVSVIVIQIGEPAKVTSLPRIQLLAKPDTVQMPQL